MPPADTTRSAAVAGLFYPGHPAELRREVDRLLAATTTPRNPPRPKALVAPHAGYVYSGAVAASAFARLAAVRDRLRLVVLLGPSHRVRFRGIALPTVRAFATPLGEVPIDPEATALARRLPAVVERDDAHAGEHSLEVHLPFLQRLLGDFALLPLAVGDADPAEVDTVLEALWGGADTLVDVSTDLSHYLSYDEARSRDRATCEAVEALRWEDISWDDACGAAPLRGLLHLARRRGLAVETLDLRSSGDTAGDRSRVVGYGAWSFTEAV